MDRVVIPGRATYSPIALTDLAFGAPLAARVLLGATGPGQVIAAASMGYYAGSAVADWAARRRVRPIDFQVTFGADVRTLDVMPTIERHADLARLGAALNEGFTQARSPREVLARRVDHHLTALIGRLTGQEVVTSTELRSVTLQRFVIPGALGTCDPLSGDVAIFTDAPGLLPHVIAHEFVHRKGYFKELHAQALAWFALRGSNDPELVQAARLERLHRLITTIQRAQPGAWTGSHLLAAAGVSPAVHALVAPFVAEHHPAPSPWSAAARALLDARMRATGQNGLSDYDEGFVSFLWTFARSDAATAPRSWADP